MNSFDFISALILAFLKSFSDKSRVIYKIQSFYYFDSFEVFQFWDKIANPTSATSALSFIVTLFVTVIFYYILHSVEKMIKAILIFNNHGKPRLNKFYQYYVRGKVRVEICDSKT